MLSPSQEQSPVPKRSFGILPAGGESQRMGTPKMRLLWQGLPLLLHAVRAMRAGGARHLVVVLHPSLSDMAAGCEGQGAIPLVLAQPTTDMKQSVLAGIELLQNRFDPAPADPLLIAPADMPQLSPAITQALLARFASIASSGTEALALPILIPVSAGKKGHPLLLPWHLTQQITQLGPEEGIRDLLKRHTQELLSCESLTVDPQSAFQDIDTPEDYSQLVAPPQ